MNVLLETQDVLQIVNDNYTLEQPQVCELIRRGYNDHYLITAGQTKYVFRIYLNGKYYIQSPEAFQFELDLIHYLHNQKVSVGFPVSRNDKNFLGSIPTALGERAAVLFSYALGSASEYDNPPTLNQCYELGKVIATFHLAANDFRSSYQRYHLGLEYWYINRLNLLLSRIAKKFENI